MTNQQSAWDAVAREYHASDMPVVEIARKYGMAVITIYAKAKRDKWARPGKPLVVQKIEQPVAADEVKAPVRRAGKTRVKPQENINASRALGRMMGIVNRLADELEQHLDFPDKPGMSATEKKSAADILTSLARALEKLTVLEREAGNHSAAGGTADFMAAENMTGTEDGWDEVQRRLARLAAAKSEG
jgi:hypothetical protein